MAKNFYLRGHRSKKSSPSKAKKDEKRRNRWWREGLTTDAPIERTPEEYRKLQEALRDAQKRRNKPRPRTAPEKQRQLPAQPTKPQGWPTPWQIASSARVLTPRRPKVAPPSPVVVLAEGVDVISDAFLLTRAWRVLRYQVLKREGARCQCCGRSPKEGAILNVDHIKPRRTHPHLALEEGNLQVLCDACNAGKGNWDETDWRKK